MKLNNKNFYDILNNGSYPVPSYKFTDKTENFRYAVVDNIFSYEFLTSLKVDFIRLFYSDKFRIIGEDGPGICTLDYKLDSYKFLYSNECKEYFNKFFPDIKLNNDISMEFRYYQQGITREEIRNDVIPYSDNSNSVKAIGFILYLNPRTFWLPDLLTEDENTSCIEDTHHPNGNAYPGELNYTGARKQYHIRYDSNLDTITNGGYLRFFNHYDINDKYGLKGKYKLTLPNIVPDGNNYTCMNKLVLFEITPNTWHHFQQNRIADTHCLFGYFYKDQINGK
jgi:hypothetical protein